MRCMTAPMVADPARAWQAPGRIGPVGDLTVLEANPIPGLTETSLLPQAAEAADITFDELVGRILELALEKAVPSRYKRHAHHWLILHGRYVCKARKPECYRCLIEDLCLFKPKTVRAA